MSHSNFIPGFELDLESLFERPWTPVRLPFFYSAALVAVAAISLLLPLLYGAFIAGAGYLSYHLVFDGYAAYFQPGPNAGPARLVFGHMLWVLSIFGSLNIALFLIKPLISPPRHRDDVFTITREIEPKFFEFIDLLCKHIGAPAPKRIDINAEPNASASLRRGLVSLFSKDDLVLTVGMSLPAGMTISQCAGVIAHELGHFTQGAGMRAFYISRYIRIWFVLAAFVPDRWDVALRRLSKHPLLVVVLLALTARLGIGVSRIALMIIILLSGVIESFFSRQMEYHADKFETRISGSESIAKTFLRIEALAAACPYAISETAERYRRTKPHELPDDFPALVANLADRLPKETLAQVQIERRAEDRGLFLSHPPTDKRIAVAQGLKEPGIITSKLPASLLFHNFDYACKTSTIGLFREILDSEVFSTNMMPLEAYLGSTTGSRDSFVRFLGFDPPAWRPIFPSLLAVPENADAKRCVAAIRSAKERLKQAAATVGPRVKAFRDDSEQLHRYDQVLAVMNAKLRVDYKRFQLQPSSRAAIAHQSDILNQRIAGALEPIDDASEAARQRLVAGLSILAVANIEQKLDDVPGKIQRANLLLGSLAAMRPLMTKVKDLRTLHAQALAIQNSVESEEQANQLAKPAIRLIADKVRDHLADIRQGLGDVEYAYPAPGEKHSLGERIAAATPGWREFDQIATAADTCVHRYIDEHRRMLSELFDLALSIEKDLARAARGNLRTVSGSAAEAAESASTPSGAPAGSGAGLMGPGS